VKTRDNRQKGRESPSNGSGPLDEAVQVARVAALVAQRHRGGQSLRSLAKEIGVSKSTVDSLVQAHDGGRRMPQPHITSDRLRKWYLRERLASADGLREPVDIALMADQMLGDIPAADRPAAIADLLALVGEIYDRRETARPAWLVRLVQPDDTAEPPTPPAPASD
jgi:hypothetical protein